jgi:hypothetical protein
VNVEVCGSESDSLFIVWFVSKTTAQYSEASCHRQSTVNSSLGFYKLCL